MGCTDVWRKSRGGNDANERMYKRTKRTKKKQNAVKRRRKKKFEKLVQIIGIYFSIFCSCVLCVHFFFSKTELYLVEFNGRICECALHVHFHARWNHANAMVGTTFNNWMEATNFDREYKKKTIIIWLQAFPLLSSVTVTSNVDCNLYLYIMNITQSADFSKMKTQKWKIGTLDHGEFICVVARITVNCVMLHFAICAKICRFRDNIAGWNAGQKLGSAISCGDGNLAKQV